MSDVLIAASDAGTGDPLDGVLVRVYSGSTLVTSGTTGDGANEDGERQFNLSAGSYTMRLSMSGNGYSVASPQSFTVTGTPADDVFDIEVEVTTRPVATDANYCRCSGFVVDPNGAVVANYNVALILQDEPVLLGNDLVSGRRVQVTTNSLGYAVVDLIRDAVYRVEMDGYVGNEVYTRIPSLSSANLPDVLYQTVASVEFDPASLTVGVGETEDVEVTIRYRSGLALDLSEFDGDLPVSFSIADGDASIAIVDDVLQITGVTAGTDTVSVDRVLSSSSPVVVYPASELTSTPVVTVAA